MQGLRIITLVLVGLLGADAFKLKDPKPFDLKEAGTETVVTEDLELQRGKTKHKKKAHGTAKEVAHQKARTIEYESQRIALEDDEIVNPKLQAHNAEEGQAVVQKLKSDEGMAYYGEISIGGQVQQGIYDTGSFDLVVLSACTKNQHPKNKKTREPVCCSRENCPKANYNHMLSGNWVKDSVSGLGKITYGSGPVTVAQGSDHVEFKNEDGTKSVSDDDVPTKVIVDHHVDLFKDTNLQAIVGLGPGKFEARETRMIHHLGMKRFTVCFNQDPNKDGMITWNDKDRSQDPAYVSVPAMGKLFWATKMTGFQISGSASSKLLSKKLHGDFKACEPSCGAIIDTGTSLLTPPKEVIEQISKLLDHGHITDCSDMSKFPTLTFQLGDKEFSLPPEAYVGKVDDEVVGFKHKNLAFPLLPMRAEKKLNSTILALKQENVAENAVEIEQGENFPMSGACAIMMSEGDPTDTTPWGPMVIFGMQLFRKYAIQFDLSGDMAGIKPSFTNPTRIMRFTEASPDCTSDSQGKNFNFVQGKTKHTARVLEGSKLQKFNLKKIRKSTFQGHLEKSRLDEDYKVAGHQFRYKNTVRI